MIKVKTFMLRDGNAKCHHAQLDDAINSFIEENGIAEIVDIKYASIACGTSDRQYCSLTAMLIYKTA